MDLSFFESSFTIENVRDVLEHYRSFGPILGISLPLLEAFLPILPLLLFVAANGAVYGFWLGAIFSWIGTCLGAVIVFLLFRKLARGRLKRWLERSRKVRGTLQWVERHGFGPLFLLYCIPFTPSSLVNVASGLSDVSFRSFLIAVMLGKAVMVFMISYVGYDWLDLIQKPFVLLGIAVVVVILWMIGKRVEIRMQKPVKQQHSE
ncbi:MAG TPA: TVP38/TMEM64 family protein [Bacillales bacterium]